MTMKIKSLSEIEKQSADFILKSFLPIPRNAVTLLSASGGTGKTRLALIMADRYIRDTNQNVALWLTEDYAGQVRHIFEDMANEHIVSLDSMQNMKLILDEPPQLAKREMGLFKANYEDIKRIGGDLIKQNVSFAIFDPLLAFYGGNENDNSEARVFIQSFAEWAKNSQITTLIIHHSNKDGNSRGATAFHDGVRARYELDIPKDENGEPKKDLIADGLRVAKLKKDNWGIRKYLWKLTEGEDELMIKVAPKLINEFNPQPKVTPFVMEETQNDNEDMMNLIGGF